jgi:uncharacterized Rmd1/YagE family protein
MAEQAVAGLSSLRGVAWFLGERIDARAFATGGELGTSPVSVRTGKQGVAVVFRYGAVVMFALDAGEQDRFLAEVRPYVRAAFARPEQEEIEIRIAADDPERLGAEGTLALRDASLDRLQVVAHVLAKSAVLAHHEAEVSRVLDRIEALAEQLERSGSGLRGRAVQREIGSALRTQLRTSGRAEIADKPELTWDAPDLERLYAHLSEEYELRDRDRILGRKLDLMARTAQISLDLLYTRRGLRVEWYIVLLIAFEILLGLYELFLRG